jgi:hypothetical protein
MAKKLGRTPEFVPKRGFAIVGRAIRAHPKNFFPGEVQPLDIDTVSNPGEEPMTNDQ